jgi:hypothetical protein
MNQSPDNNNNKWFGDHIAEDIANVLIRIRVTLGDEKSVSRDFRPDVDIDYEDLETQLTTTPSMYAYWAMVMSEQRTAVSIIERKIKRRRAMVAKTIIETGKQDGIKISAAEIKELIDTDDELQKLEVQFLLAQRAAGKLYHIVEAIKMKSEHLRSLAGFKRQEMRESGTM